MRMSVSSGGWHLEMPNILITGLVLSEQTHPPQVQGPGRHQGGRLLPADGPEQCGAGLIVEGDDDAGGGQVLAVHQQGASGEAKTGG